MKIYTLLLLAILTFASCINDKKRNIYSSVEEWKENTINSDEMIVIDKSFKPTIELSNEIIESSLEELIIKKYYENNNLESRSPIESIIELLVLRKELTYEDFLFLDSKELAKKIRILYEVPKPFLEDFFKDKESVEKIRRKMQKELGPKLMNEVQLTTINKNTNVAKAYFLQDFDSFIEYNSKYYNEIINKEKQKEHNKKEQERIESWEKYNAIPIKE